MPQINRPFAASAAMLAALSLGTPQAFALDIPVHSNAPLEIETVAGEVQQHHRYRGYRHRRGPSAGQIIAGVAVIGAIAAIAGAASKNNRDNRRERVETYPRRDNVRYRDNREEQRYDRSSDSRGIDRAVDMCIEQVERGNTRVDSVDDASRGADGWRVSGALTDGDGWNCWIDNDGRVRSVDLGSRYSVSSDSATSDRATSSNAIAGNSVRFESAAAAGEGQPQMSDTDYARARARVLNGQSAAPVTQTVVASDQGVDADLRAREEELRAGEAAYPGGPVEGEEYPGGEWVDDGRYNSAEASARDDRG